MDRRTLVHCFVCLTVGLVAGLITGRLSRPTPRPVGATGATIVLAFTPDQSRPVDLEVSHDGEGHRTIYRYQNKARMDRAHNVALDALFADSIKAE